MSDNALTSDVYGIAEHVNSLKKDYFSADEESLMVGTLGYIGALFTNQWQNQIVMTSQYSNEAIPTKAKFKKNVIAHALSLDAIDITATPAVMDVYLFIPEDEIIANLNKHDQLTIDSTQAFHVGNYEFRLDYDILITRTKIQGKYVYTAQYLDIHTNPVSTIENPYLKPPVIMNIEKIPSLLITCQLRQVAHSVITKRILSSSSIENKTFSFSFDDQLAAFNIDVTDNGVTKRLTPVYVGMYDGSIADYFYYEYLDDNTIRVKFDPQSYIPRINSIIDVNVYTTAGAAGVFKYTESVTENLQSSKYGYSNLTATILLSKESTTGGYNSKTVAELKTMIPKEALSRGNIATSTDLNNYFDLINTSDSKLYFQKKRHNQQDLLFYSHFLFRDKQSNILPTNTIKLELAANDFDMIVDDENNQMNKKYILNPGTIIKYSPGTRVGKKCTLSEYLANREPRDDDPEYRDPNFYYTLPFSMVINANPMYLSYYLNIVQTSKLLEFSYVNPDSENQFIASEAVWTRDYSSDPEERNQYALTVDMVQNIAADRGIVVEDKETGEKKCVGLRVFAVFYNSTGVPYMYKELEMVAFNDAEYLYTFQAKVQTEDELTSEDRLKVWGMHYKGTSCDEEMIDKGIGDFDHNTQVSIYILTKSEDGSHGLDDTANIITGLDDWTLSNKYKIIDGVDFFFNYTNIISSVVTVGAGNVFTIKQVPMIRYEYLSDIDNVYDFIEQMELRRQYIESCLNTLEGPMGIDFKFYNTYGPAETYYIDDGSLDRVNMKLTFRTKILSGADKYLRDYIVRDIKEYIENMEDIKDLHMPNITTLIEKTYHDQISYFQFVSINEYPTNIQHIVKMDTLEVQEEEHVPEFLNIGVNDEGLPDIEIIIDT